MSVSVCLCVCLFAIISSELHIIKFFMHVTCGRGSVLLWQRIDTLCTSGLWMASYLLISQGYSTLPPG